MLRPVPPADAWPPRSTVLPGQSTGATSLLKTASFDGNRRATAPEQLALLGRDHPLANQTIERLIKTLRSRGWNQLQISANQASNGQDGCAQESYGWDTNSGPAAPGFSP